MKMLHRRGIIKTAIRPRQTCGLIEGLERAGFNAAIDLQRPLAGLGDDVDHAADGIGAIECALRTAQHFDLGDVAGKEFGNIRRAAGRGGIGDIDAVQQHLDVVGIGAAHEQRGLTARAAGLHDVEARHGAQHVWKRTILARFDLGGGDDGDAAGDLLHRGGDTGGDHHHVFVIQALGAGRAGQGDDGDRGIKNEFQH